MTFSTISAKWLQKLIRLWPPLWFTGIHFDYIADDFKQITVSMPLRFYNKNLIGIQYGGNLFSMTDPCYMMMLMKVMGKQYNVIDQAANIEFIKPGKSRVNATCILTDNDISDIRQQTANGEKYCKSFFVNIVDEDNEVVAKVERMVYVRRKKHSQQAVNEASH